MSKEPVATTPANLADWKTLFSELKRKLGVSVITSTSVAKLLFRLTPYEVGPVTLSPKLLESKLSMLTHQH